MTKRATAESFEIEGDDGISLHATWSRSGKRLIVSIHRNWTDAAQVELTPEQAEAIGRFLVEGSAGK